MNKGIISKFGVETDDFMLLPAIKMKIFSVGTNIACPSFLIFEYFITVCLEHIVSFS